MDPTQYLSPPKKRRAKHFSVEDKERILNIFKVCCEQNPNNNKTENVAFAAKAAGICVASVHNILREYNKEHRLDPPKVYYRKRAILDNINDLTKSKLRRLVHNFFERNEPPTIKKIMTALHEDEDMPHLKRTTLRLLLKEIGFKFCKRSRNSVLKEKSEIVVWRRRYLREIRRYRQEGRKIYFLDETWLNAGHTLSKVWKDTTILTARQAFINDVTTGLKDPSGKGSRLIILHIGSEDGFVDGGLLCFQSKKTGDYHEEMTADVFEKWFKEVLGRLDTNSVIVMDNAPYHSRKLEKIPNSATKKADIQAWLSSKSIAYGQDMIKDELLALVKEAGIISKFVVDEMATEQHRTVLRLPPYHCELNPIELIWGQIKGEVARNNLSFKMKDLLPIFNQATTNVTPDNWRHAIRHTVNEEEKMWQLDIIIDIQVEPLIIHLGSDSSSSSSDSESED